MIGIIAEDKSDLECARILIQRIADKPVSVTGFIGRGSGNIRKKCNAWANLLLLRGCTSLIVVHDLDHRKKEELESEISRALKPCPIAKNLICIPVQELEAWLLSDSRALQESLNLKRLPKNIANPEMFNSPKEMLNTIIRKASDGGKLYLNTKHNQLISQHVSIQNIKAKCLSFHPLYAFATEIGSH